MLSVNNISMRFGPRVLFEDVTCTFMAGRRYAVTGPNGAGKSTFMKILTGELEPTKGSISAPKKMGILRQDQFAFDELILAKDAHLFGGADGAFGGLEFASENFHECRFAGAVGAGDGVAAAGHKGAGDVLKEDARAET